MGYEVLEGRTLDKCRDAKELRECLLHALLGWLSVYQRGYFYRNICVRNILVLAASSRAAAGPFNPLDLCATSSGGQVPQEVQHIAKELKKTLEENPDLGSECTAILIDDDTRASVPVYHCDQIKHRACASIPPSTLYFMSSRLRANVERPDLLKPYVQSPIDDIWSFYWTALWATLHKEERSWKDRPLREREWVNLLGGSLAERDRVAADISDRGYQYEIQEISEYSPMLKQMAPFLCSWHKALSAAQDDWATATRTADAKGEDQLKSFHLFAYRCVLDFVKLVAGLGDKGIS